jgi:hypothetical protein
MDVAPEYNVTTLSNGFTVLTESQTFPGAVHMGKSLFFSLFNINYKKSNGV